MGEKIHIDWDIITGFNWYIYELIVFYLMFYFTYKYIKKRWAKITIICLISIMVCITAWYLSNRYPDYFTHAYHFSSLCFAWGIMIHEFYTPFVEMLVKRIVFSTIILLVMGAVSCISLKMPQGSFVGGVILHNIVGISVMTVVVLWAHRVEFRSIPVIGFLTKYSTEIYLYQFVVLNILYEIFLRYKLEINVVYIVMTLICTMALAFVMKKVDNMVLKSF